ncbi:SEC-C metal-binding domain-containing protein [Bacteroidota bacterium]|nr:SEC-C metal-binding domain-containing protein [Bacteroidota bacterium]
MSESESCCNNSSCCGPSSPFQRTQPKVGRNNPCPCGSGRKYKKCCGSF